MVLPELTEEEFETIKFLLEVAVMDAKEDVEIKLDQYNMGPVNTARAYLVYIEQLKEKIENGSLR